MRRTAPRWPLDPRLAALLLLLLGAPVLAEDAFHIPSSDTAQKIEQLRDNADRLRARAYSLSEQAEVLWEATHYDHAQRLEEQADDLMNQADHLDEEANRVEHPAAQGFFPSD